MDSRSRVALSLARDDIEVLFQCHFSTGGLEFLLGFLCYVLFHVGQDLRSCSFDEFLRIHEAEFWLHFTNSFDDVELVCSSIG